MHFASLNTICISALGTLYGTAELYIEGNEFKHSFFIRFSTLLSMRKAAASVKS